MDRVLQCVSPAGVVSSVFTMMASTCSSEIVRGAPTRGSSYRPSSRRSTNWLRHFATVVFVVRRRRATAVSEASIHANTIRARNATARFTRAALRQSHEGRALVVGDHHFGSGASNVWHAPVRSQVEGFLLVISFPGD